MEIINLMFERLIHFSPYLFGIFISFVLLLNILANVFVYLDNKLRIKLISLKLNIKMAKAMRNAVEAKHSVLLSDLIISEQMYTDLIKKDRTLDNLGDLEKIKETLKIQRQQLEEVVPAELEILSKKLNYSEAAFQQIENDVNKVEEIRSTMRQRLTVNKANYIVERFLDYIGNPISKHNVDTTKIIQDTQIK